MAKRSLESCIYSLRESVIPASLRYVSCSNSYALLINVPIAGLRSTSNSRRRHFGSRSSSNRTIYEYLDRYGHRKRNGRRVVQKAQGATISAETMLAALWPVITFIVLRILGGKRASPH